MRFLVILACVTCFPTAVLAQAAIAGIVTDESGGAMQGVVVEASSPSLIERVRTAVTDGTGRYRNLSGNAPNVTVNLIAPGTMYGDRINQLDARVAKTLRYGRSRTLIALDIYDALNSSAVLTYNNTFVPGGTWLQPLTISRHGS